MYVCLSINKLQVTVLDPGTRKIKRGKNVLENFNYWPIYGFFGVFLFFFGYFLSVNELQIIRFDPRNYCFEIFYEVFIFFTIFLWGGGVCGGGMAYDNLPPERSSSARCCACFSPFTFLFPHPIFVLHLLHFYNRVILKIIYFLIFRRKKTHFLKENMDFFIFRVISLVLKIP